MTKTPMAAERSDEASVGEKDDESAPCSLLSYECVDDVTLPAVDVSGTKFVAIRLTKGGLLFRYSDSAVPALASKHRWQRIRRMTSAEANLLNAANKDCNRRHAKSPYVVGDIMVDVESFRRFYDIVRDCVALAVPHRRAAKEGGWLQMNNSVCPYVWRDDIRHVPLIIVTVAADVSLEGGGEEAKSSEAGRLAVVRVTQLEMSFLNDLCTKANQDYRFSAETDLVSLVDVKLASDAVIFELPLTDNPFEYSVYLGRMDAETVATARMALKAAWDRLCDTEQSPAPEQNGVVSVEADTGSRDSGEAAMPPSVAHPARGAANQRVASSDTDTATSPERSGSESFSDVDTVMVLSPGGVREGRPDGACSAAPPSPRIPAAAAEALELAPNKCGKSRGKGPLCSARRRPLGARSSPGTSASSFSRDSEQHRTVDLSNGASAIAGVSSELGETSHRTSTHPRAAENSCFGVGRTVDTAAAHASKRPSPMPDSGSVSPLQSPAEKRLAFTECSSVEARAPAQRQTLQLLDDLLRCETVAPQEQPQQSCRTTSTEPLPEGASVDRRPPPLLLSELLQDEPSIPQEQPPQATSSSQLEADVRQSPPPPPPPLRLPPSKQMGSAKSDAVAVAQQIALRYPTLDAILRERHAAGLTCDVDVLRMLAWFMHIQQQLFIVLRHQRSIVQELRGCDAILVVECDGILGEMLSSLKFWLSRQHDLPPRMRAVLHHTLSCAVLQRRVQSHLNYLIGGLFMVEPATAAENFTFLRNAVALAMVAQGVQLQEQPAAAYVVAERCKSHLMRRMTAWSTLNFADAGAFNREDPQSWCDALVRVYNQVYSFTVNGAERFGVGRSGAAFVEYEAQQLRRSTTVAQLQRMLLQHQQQPTMSQRLLHQAPGQASSTVQQQQRPPTVQIPYSSGSPEQQLQQEVAAVAIHQSGTATASTRSANLATAVTSVCRQVNDATSPMEAAALALAEVAAGSATVRAAPNASELDRGKRPVSRSPGAAGAVTLGPFDGAAASEVGHSLHGSRRGTPTLAAAADAAAATSGSRSRFHTAPKRTPDQMAGATSGAWHASASSDREAGFADGDVRWANNSDSSYFYLPPTTMPALPAITRQGTGSEQWMLVGDAARAFFSALYSGRISACVGGDSGCGADPG